MAKLYGTLDNCSSKRLTKCGVHCIIATAETWSAKIITYLYSNKSCRVILATKEGTVIRELYSSNNVDREVK